MSRRLECGRALCSDAEAERRGFGGPACERRRAVLGETLAAFDEADPLDRYEHLAAENLERWRREAEQSSGAPVVQVLRGDWGAVTHALTQKHGTCFAVLNMANAYAPGGAYVEGATAQEENIFRRTDCHFHIDPETFDRGTDEYLPEMTRLLSGEDGLVYLDTAHPRVCIRGPEDREAADLGYPWLSPHEVFPFYEMRAAAQDLRGGEPFDPVDARRRIAAQLDTLRAHGIRHTVLGASGCGAFQNPSREVASIYKDEIAARGVDFDVVAFAIFAAGYGPGNYAPFAEVLA